MNEEDFKSLWESEKPVYQEWGKFIVDRICKKLEKQGKNLNSFLKVPINYRLKDTSSLVDKAFYRPGKNYDDPYNEIEDKVGVRVVVLLLKDLEEVCDVINKSSDWNLDPCKHFQEDREKNPLLFTYQSVHYILRPKKDLEINGRIVKASTPCEVQVRTLLQHAHAELTHDAIYKAKKEIKPEVHRTVAKSMALIETTDDFFTDVVEKLNWGPVQEHKIIAGLDGLYFSWTGIQPIMQKSSIAIWDVFEDLITGDLLETIRLDLEKIEQLPDIIKERYSKNSFYHQSTVLFVYWMLRRRKERLLRDWPLPEKPINMLANDLGISIAID